MGELLIGAVIYIYVAAVMLGIGIMQCKSKKPVGFYSGEKPPMESELSDVILWNKKHGKMWIWYGIIILLSYLSGIPFLVIDTVWCVVPLCGGLLLPLPVMIWYHHKLIREYKKG